MDVYYIVYAVPAFFVLIGVELVVGIWRGRNTYRVADAVTSIGTGVLSVVTGVFTRGLRLGLYTWGFASLSLVQLPAGHWAVWLLAILGYDFAYYWFHRLSHERNLLWASHAVHHQSEDFNLSTALRQSSTGFLFDWPFYLPLAILGVPPVVFATAAAINLLYQYWVHTQHVGKLGWLDRVLVTASNHRVHHGQNAAYIDRNYGGMLILWDRLFGTYAEEQDDDPVIYGVRKPLASWNPVWANLHGYGTLLRDARLADNWRDRLRVWFARTGWRPPAAAALAPSAAADLSRFRRYDTPLSRRRKSYVLCQFALVVVAAVAFLALASQWPLWRGMTAMLLIAYSLASLGWLLEGRRGARRAEVVRWLVVAAGTAVWWPAGWPVVVTAAVLSLAGLGAELKGESGKLKGDATAGPTAV